MQPYVNPYYLQQNQQVYPQYYNPLAQVQNRSIDYQQNIPNNYQQNQIVQGINGKIIAELSQITANDVPMDGSVAFFPKQDLSEVYAKSWNADGTIRTVTYKPVLDNDPKTASEPEKIKCDLSEESAQNIMNKFDEISDRLGQLEKSLQSQRKTSQTQRKDD
jgi:hypothetical protein